MKNTDKFVLTEKAIKREEFLKRISNLKWNNAEVIVPRNNPKEKLPK